MNPNSFVGIFQCRVFSGDPNCREGKFSKVKDTISGRTISCALVLYVKREKREKSLLASLLLVNLTHFLKVPADFKPAHGLCYIHVCLLESKWRWWARDS